MSENCSSLEGWAYRPAFPDSCWISDAFARETEVLTRALQISLSGDSSNSNTNSACTLSPSSLQFIEPDPAGPVTGFQPESKRLKNPILSSNSGRVTKRKSRATKKSTTTFITADPANFRQMVQQVTGVRFSGSDSVEPVLKPEPHRMNRAGLAPEECLPTLDTSAFLLDRPVLLGTESASHGSVGPAVGQPSGFIFEPFPSFPTLESWSVM